MKYVLFMTLLLMVACQGGDGTVPVRVKQTTTEDTLIQGNRHAVKLEDRDILLFLERIGARTQKTPRGIHVQLLRDLPGTTASTEQWAKVNYRMELLNGDTAYSSPSGSPESFLIERDDVESGLHEGIQFLSPGDSAMIVIPSYRAHGLIGDMDKVPMRSTVVYYIGLVNVSDGR